MGETVKTNTERLYDILSHHSVEEVRTAYILRAKDENGRVEFSRNWLLSNGYEEIEDPGRMLLPDGRLVSRIRGKAYALNIDEHNRRREEAFAAEKQEAKMARESRSVDEASESIAQMTCKCGGSLQKTKMCSSCTLGKLGYRYRYTCDSCEMDIVAKMEFDL